MTGAEAIRIMARLRAVLDAYHEGQINDGFRPDGGSSAQLAVVAARDALNGSPVEEGSRAWLAVEGALRACGVRQIDRVVLDETVRVTLHVRVVKGCEEIGVAEAPSFGEAVNAAVTMARDSRLCRFEGCERPWDVQRRDWRRVCTDHHVQLDREAAALAEVGK